MADADFEFELGGNIDDLRESIDDLATHIGALGDSIEDSLGEQTGAIKNQLDTIEASAKEWGFSMADIATTAFAAWEIGGDILDGIRVSFSALISEVRTWIDAAIEADQIDAQLAVRLESTGRAAEFTVESLSAMADELESITTFGDETIRSVELMQLRFTQVKGEEFERVTKAALNMAVAMKTDPSSAALILGRALENPIRGMDMLRRQYVNFVPEQREAIKAFMLMGDTASAQRIILDEVEKSVNKSAEAAAKASGGGWKQILNIFENVKEELGHELMPTLEALVPAVKFVAQEVADALKAITKHLADIGKEVAGAFAVTPAEQFVGVMAHVFTHLKNILQVLQDLGAAWRSIKLTGLEIDEKFGGGDPAALGAKHNNDIQIAMLTRRKADAEAMVKAGTAPGFLGEGPNPAELAEHLRKVTEKLDAQLTIRAEREKKESDAQSVLEKLRRDVARDDARLNENKNDKTGEELSKEWVAEFRKNTEALKGTTDWYKLHKDLLGPEKLPPLIDPQTKKDLAAFSQAFPGMSFKKFDLEANMKSVGQVGSAVQANFNTGINNLLPPWAESFKNNLVSIAGGMDDIPTKIKKVMDETKSFATDKLGDALEAVVDPLLKGLKPEKQEARLESFQTMFSRITIAHANREMAPEQRTAKNTEKAIEQRERHIKLQERTLTFGEMSQRSLDALNKKMWGGLQ